MTHQGQNRKQSVIFTIALFLEYDVEFAAIRLVTEKNTRLQEAACRIALTVKDSEELYINSSDRIRKS